jgi:hypothetical protein
VQTSKEENCEEGDAADEEKEQTPTKKTKNKIQMPKRGVKI